jgi:hypothetical protein
VLSEAPLVVGSSVLEALLEDRADRL